MDENQSQGCDIFNDKYNTIQQLIFHEFLLQTYNDPKKNVILQKNTTRKALVNRILKLLDTKDYEKNVQVKNK